MPVVIAALVTAAATSLILWAHTDSVWLGVWLTVLIIVNLGRLVLIHQFHHQAPSQLDRWKVAYLVGTALAGAAWGSSALLLDVTPSISHQVFIVVVIAGMAAGALSSNAVLPSIYGAFLSLALIPLAGWLLLSEHGISQFAPVVVLYGLVLFLYSRKQRHILLEAVRLQHENLDLVNNLTHSNQHLSRSNENQIVLKRLLKMGLEKRPLNEILSEAVEVVCSVPWIHLSSKGAIFLTDQSHDTTLNLVAPWNLAPELIVKCDQIVFGQCLCGRAAESRQIQFAHCVDARHDIHYDGMQNHGHYNVPILSGPEVLGVLVLYLNHGHQHSDTEESFLKAVAHSLASIIERKHAEEELKTAASAFDNSLEGIVITDSSSKIINVNRAYTQLTGYSAEEVIGKNPSILRSRHHEKAFYQQMWQTLTSEGQWQGEIWNRRKSGEVFPAWQSITAVKDEHGDITRYIGIFGDISAQKQAEEQMASLAYYDVLTKLPNRILFEDRLYQATEQARRQQQQLAVLFIDIDRFRKINNSFGYPVGDQILQTIAERLSNKLRKEDTVAHLGGDAFAVILANIANVHAAKLVCSKLQTAIERPIRFQDQEIFTSVSVGVSLFPDDGTDIKSLIEKSDTALHQAVSAGAGQCRFYASNMTATLAQRSVLENELRQAIDDQALTVHFQPQVALRSDNVIGIEALARWYHPQHGMVSPAQFIPIAEESGLIISLSECIFRQAVAQWKSLFGNSATAPRLSINVSTYQFDGYDLEGFLMQLLEESQMAPGQLEVEVTESALVNNVQHVVEVLNKLRNKGIHIAIDDFGTGYSALSYLVQLPIDTIKIDRAFVMNILENQRDATLIRAIISMCKSLHLEVIAEGAESPEQLDMLRELDCDIVQGYVYSKPLPADELRQFVQQQQQSLAG